MSLNKEFFDKIQIELVKRKYYNANKVDALLSEIRTLAVPMAEENLRLSQQLSALNAQKAEIGEAVMSAQLLYSDILQKANQRADERCAQAEVQAQALLKDAQEKARRIVEEAQRKADGVLASVQEQQHIADELEDQIRRSREQRQEYAVQHVEKCFAHLRQQYQTALEELNGQWQQFLCGLYEEEQPPMEETAARPAAINPTPAEVEKRLQAIAQDLAWLKND